MQSPTLNRRSIVGGIAALAAALSARGAFAQADKPVRIGFSMARTGMLANATPSQSNTYELWKEQVNARGGMDVGGQKRKVEFVTYDDQSKPEQAVRIYEKLITDDKVDLLLAPWGTPFQIAIAPVLEKFKFPMVGNTAASVALRQVKPGYIWFPTSAIPDRIGVELTAMLKAQNVKSAVVLSNVLPFTKEIKNYLEPELKKAGIEIKLSTEYPPDIKDMTSILTQVKQANPDAVLALAYPSDSVLYAKQAKELGIASPFQFIAIGPSDAFFAKAVGAASAEGVVTIAHWTPRAEWKGSQAFYDAYVKKFGEDPDYLNSALAWMSLEILETAVAKAGLDKNKIRQIVSTETFDTINGKVRFDGVQNAITPTAFVQTQKGKLQLVWPKSIATGQYEPKKSW
ncbi:amino acid ABC transporter substrate-binding protein [Variovorax sp. PBL-E5]|uniref:amino acid ABC transporter substrate-binding protein n=1 Tax=Variovorax sp. PBL-E5 TaxID=434014 RepID=UPI001316FA9F|nr:amino acid ABC transporter substrate-binding protein [Variovorax sp. PBL-E5]VTU19194.1 Leucine-, isoleucine-, valine-, threonine-, and alanine-binding protein precursor [Variovorax sp. PBL-E5]